MIVKNNTMQVISLIDGQVLRPFKETKVNPEDEELLEQINSLKNLGLVSILQKTF